MSDLSRLVKPLVWRQVEPHIYAAETSAHAYVIFDLDAGPILTRDSVQVASGVMPDLKTFAQADYTARIIAALDPEALARWRDEAVQAEREACAETVESLWAYRTCSEVAAAIRARKGGEA
jgi:hypothetical protein